MRHIVTAAEWLIELVALAAFAVFLAVAAGVYTGVLVP